MGLAQKIIALCEATQIPTGARWVTVMGRHILVNADGNPVNPNVKMPSIGGVQWKHQGDHLVPHVNKDTGKLAKWQANKQAQIEKERQAQQLIKQVKAARQKAVKWHDKIALVVAKHPGINPEQYKPRELHKMTDAVGVNFPSYQSILNTFKVAEQKGLIVFKNGGWYIKGQELSSKQELKPKGSKPLTTKQKLFASGDTESVEKHGNCGINPAYIVKVKNDGKGIWKPVKGEYTSWDRMDKSACKWANREVMAYEMTRILGDEFDGLVPQTTLRDLEKKDFPEYEGYPGQGSCQHWVENFEVGMYNKPLSDIPPEEILRAGAFDILIGHYDRHTGNFGYANGKLVFIDNGIAFTNVEYPEDVNLSFLLYNKSKIKNAHDNKLPKKLQPLQKMHSEMIKELKQDADFRLPFERAVENWDEIAKLFDTHKLPIQEKNAFIHRIQEILGKDAFNKRGKNQ